MIRADAVPEIGQLVEVRGRHWVVTDVTPSGLPLDALGGETHRQNLLDLSSVEDDALSEELQVVWEAEVGRRIRERATLPEVGPDTFDDPATLAAFLDAVRWGAVTSAESDALQAPFRSGIAIEEYQLDPLVRALGYWWAIKYGSTMRTDLRYTPSDVFETFPLPTPTPRLDAAGEALDAFRRPLMLDRDLGLTALYNLVHDQAVRDADVRRLRDLHVEIDHAAAAAYGWDDLPLGHDFHPTRQGPRFTVSEAARTELLDRLLELNHERHAREEARGLSRGRGRRAPAAGHQQELL